MAIQTMNESKTNQNTTETSAESSESVKAPFLWRLTLIAGILAGLGWTLILLLGPGGANLLAGIAPVIAGIYVGRRVEGRALGHGAFMSLVSTLIALLIIVPIIFTASAEQATQMTQGIVEQQNVDVSELRFQALTTFGMFMLISLIPFPIYGVMIASSSKKRNAAMREEVERRGGNLGRPGRVLTLDDMQALTLPKFGSWVTQLFKDNGFALRDYKFNKDVVDLFMERTEHGEMWIVRCTVADGVKSGMVQALSQELNESDTYIKGVVVTPYSVQSGAYKWVKSRKHIDVLDGETLWEIHSA